MTIPGFEAIQELFRNDRTRLCRARRTGDGRSSLLKMPLSGVAASSEVASLKSELHTLSRLSIPGIPRNIRLLPLDGTCCLAMDDPGGEPLQTLVPSSAPEIDKFLSVALALVPVLGEIHRQEIIHNGINLKTILFNANDGTVTLTDFSMAAPASEEFRRGTPEVIDGALLYLSPERTGRIHRTVDYRSDYYSLGIAFYELLTGTRPCVAADPLETIHWHIAGTPLPPSQIHAEIPLPLSEIILTLLAKTAEERYQSASGLLDDLSICAREWKERRWIPSFPLRRSDVSNRFLIPAKLYGREEETERLLTAFASASEGRAAMAMVTGYSGIGKTSLILELRQPVLVKRGRFVTGKFDQVVRNIPYGALIEALRNLVVQLLAESEEEIAKRRSRIGMALGANGGVLAAVIPEIEILLGAQPPPPELGSAEARNRFQLVIQSFVASTALPEHPLVIFLDDLQWADSATLDLLPVLLAGAEVRHLLLIGAYRDNEVGPGHPLLEALSRLAEAGVARHSIVLGSLDADEVTALLKDTLHREASDVRPVADIVLSKTDGNPFFVVQFLKMLRQEGFLKLDPAQGGWTYSLQGIRDAPITDNVADLMTRKIRHLTPAGQNAVTLAACLGNRFDLTALAAVSSQPLEAAGECLGEAVAAGLLRKDTASGYAFAHDRVQQAAYAMITDGQKERAHLAVGRLMWNGMRPGPDDDGLFDVVHHLNRGSRLIADDNERVELAGLNLGAGRRAKRSAAYQGALAYLRKGIDLLEPDRWRTERELLWSLHMEAAECEYLCGRFAEAEVRFDLLLTRAQTSLERATIHNLRIIQHENTSRYADAVRCGREGLAAFGVVLAESADEKREGLQTELRAIETLLAGRNVSDLTELPVMEDPEKRLIMTLLTSVWASTYISGDQALTRLISATLVRLSLEHGNAEESAYGYVTHAITVGPVLGDYRSAYEWGSLALSINERFADAKRRAKIQQQFNAHVNLWRRPFETCVPYAREAYRSGLENGDFTYAGYGAFTESWPAFLSCRHLARFIRDYTPHVALLEQLRMPGLAAGLRLILNWARALEGQTAGNEALSGGQFDERGYLEAYGENPFFATFYHVAKLHLHFTFQSYEAALEAALRARERVKALAGTVWPVLLDFLYGLTLCALYAGKPERQPSWLEELSAIQERLDRLAEACPENFSCYSLLLRATRSSLSGHDIEAMDCYERAIRYTHETENAFTAGLANELYASFWEGRGNAAIRSLYLDEARRAFQEWGATAKAEDLQNRQPAPAAGPVSVDAASVARSAHAISVEIIPKDLLRKLMQIAMENAGAQRVIFLESGRGTLIIQADAAAGEAPRVMEGKPFEQAGNLSCAVVRYAWHTGMSVVVEDASSDERFGGDPYIATARPRSILCVPVKHQGESAGVLYLENNLATHVFTENRVRVMQILCAQAAISMANARAHEELHQEVERRRRAEEELREALADVQSLKRRIEEENTYLQEEIRRGHNFEEIVGESPALTDLLEQVERIAPTESTVLIYGETGTGKELIARALHSRSRRRDRPLVIVNCGAISAGLVESELFGHVKGAFTGALERRTGRFEIADGGTLFLDEIGEIPPETQVKLLRALQQGEFEPVGSSKTMHVNVRIIAASNRWLEDEVKAGRFRADLFYRLNVLPLRVPPLRERADDIPQLVMFFLTHFSTKLGKKLAGVSEATMKRLIAYPWPGNIRELQNVIERAVVLSQDRVLSLDANFLPAAVPAGAKAVAAAPGSGGKTLKEMERTHIERALSDAHWVIEGPHGAARALSMHPNTLRSRMKKLGIRRPTHEN